jgi:molybdopterin-guanine dinucleotide biosynthesis protein A
VSDPVGAIVAGGGAVRFGGAPKGLQRVGGVRIIDRVASALRATTSELMVISNALDAPRWIPGVAVHGDVRPERGSLVGIHTALTYARGDALVVAWDMPFVSPELLGLIRDREHRSRMAVIPEGPSGLEPFCALYTRECLPIIERALEDGDLGVSRVIARLPSIARIPLREVESLGDPAVLFFNVNTADDLAAAERLDASARSRRISPP